VLLVLRRGKRFRQVIVDRWTRSHLSAPHRYVRGSWRPPRDACPDVRAAEPCVSPGRVRHRATVRAAVEEAGPGRAAWHPALHLLADDIVLPFTDAIPWEEIGVFVARGRRPEAGHHPHVPPVGGGGQEAAPPREPGDEARRAVAATCGARGRVPPDTQRARAQAATRR
jgi:hypothetical protein